MSDHRGIDPPDVPEPPLSSEETLTSVRIAEQYLEEAERVLWETADRTADPEAAETLEAVTQYVWTIQNELDDLEGELEAPAADGGELQWPHGE